MNRLTLFLTLQKLTTAQNTTFPSLKSAIKSTNNFQNQLELHFQLPRLRKLNNNRFDLLLALSSKAYPIRENQTLSMMLQEMSVSSGSVAQLRTTGIKWSLDLFWTTRHLLQKSRTIRTGRILISLQVLMHLIVIICPVLQHISHRQGLIRAKLDLRHHTAPKPK